MNPLERLLAFAIALAQELVRGILAAVGLGLKRAVNPIEIERASADEVVDLRHLVLRAGRPRDTAIFDGDTRPATRHWVARQTDRVVAVVSVMQTSEPDGPATWQLRGMAVLPELQGTGVGRALLEAVQIDVNDALWCNARQNVAAFYTRSGWETVGSPFELPPIGPHVRMRYSPTASATNR